jgi:hypothetical protein
MCTGGAQGCDWLRPSKPCAAWGWADRGAGFWGGGEYLIQPLQCDHSANCVRAMTGVAVLLVVQKVWAVSYPEGLWDAATGMVLA